MFLNDAGKPCAVNHLPTYDAMKQSLRALPILGLTVLLVLLGLAPVRAQGVGIGTTAPDASAALDVVSSTKGALLPRVSEATRTTMPAPAAGLLLYQTNGAKPGFWYNAGGTGVGASPPVGWVRLTDSAGLSFDLATGLQVGPGPVQSGGPFTVGTTAGGLNVPFSDALAQKVEIVYTAAELLATGMHAGPVLALSYFINTKNSTTPYNGFTIRLGPTAAATTTTTYTPGLTLVYQGNVTTALGNNTFVFNQSPFTWDGTSNLVVETCYTNAIAGANDFTNYFADAANQLLTSGACANATGGTYPARLVVSFSQAPASYTLPPLAGTGGQVLTMQPSGAAIWDDPAWLRNGPNAYRPAGLGAVSIGSLSARTRLNITPSLIEPKITLWDGGLSTAHYGFGISAAQLNYHVIDNTASHVFYAGGKNGDGTELLRLTGTGYLGVGTGAPTARLDVVAEASNGGGVDDIVMRAYGPTAAPGLALHRYRGTVAAPANMRKNDFMGVMGMGGRVNGALGGGFVLSSLSGNYLGNGLTPASDLYFNTSGLAQAVLDSTGRFGIGIYPNYELDVAGTIHAATDKGVVLDAQDRPIITRGWDPFTSGNYTGLGRWGLFMEYFNLTMGVPELANRDFQWATYDLTSTINRRLMRLSQAGNLGVGTGTNALTERVQVEGGSAYINGEASGVLVDAGGQKRTGLLKYSGEYAGLWRVTGADFKIGRVANTAALPGTPAPADLLPDLFISSTGTVGLGGIVSPQAALEVRGSGVSSQIARARIRSTNDQAGIGLVAATAGGTPSTEAVMYQPQATSDLRFYVGGTDRVSILSTGQVGIGIQPATTETLDVNGPARATEVHTPGTGTNNMLAVAYGQLSTNAGASVYSSSGNYTVSNIGVGQARLTFTAASGLSGVSFTTLPVTVTIWGNAPGFASWNTAGGNGTIDVYTYNVSGVATIRDFNVVVFRP